MMLFIRIGSLLVSLIAAIYGAIIIKKRAMPKYFIFALCAIVAQLLAYIYYFALETDDSLQVVFTLGVFGEIASYLFVSGANIKLIPNNEGKKSLSVVGLIVALVAEGMIVGSIFVDPSLPTIVNVILMSLSGPLCIYSCISVIENKNNNDFKKSIKLFNIIFLIIVFISCFLQLYMLMMLYGFKNSVTSLILCIIYIIWMLCSLISTFVLKKGLESWEG